MLETLAQICNDGGPLVDVSYALLDCERPFVTTVALRLEHLTVVFRAISDDDTLAASVGPLVAAPTEITEEAGGELPWTDCVGLGVCWGWRLTNQQGYIDGVRLEFSAEGESSRAVVELVAIASGIRILTASETRRRLTWRRI